MKERAEWELGKKPKWWKRFVDDVFGVWKGTICNGNEERIKVTYEICEREAV